MYENFSFLVIGDEERGRPNGSPLVQVVAEAEENQGKGGNGKSG